VSMLHLRNASADPWEVGSQGSSYSIGSNKSQTAGGGRGKSGGNARGSYNRGSSIPSLKRHDTSTSTTSTSSLKQHRQDSHGQVSRKIPCCARQVSRLAASLSVYPLNWRREIEVIRARNLERLTTNRRG